MFYCQSDVFDSVFWVCCVTGVVLTVLSVFADSLFCVTGVVLCSRPFVGDLFEFLVCNCVL